MIVHRERTQVLWRPSVPNALIESFSIDGRYANIRASESPPEAVKLQGARLLLASLPKNWKMLKSLSNPRVDAKGMCSRDDPVSTYNTRQYSISCKLKLLITPRSAP